MAFWLWTGLAAALLLLGILALLSTVKVRVRYSHSGKYDQLVVIVRAVYGIVRMRTVIPAILLKGGHLVYNQERNSRMAGFGRSAEPEKRRFGRHSMRRYRKAFGAIRTSTRDFAPWLRQTMSKVECTRWRTDVRLGTGEAASTATLSGLLWSVMGCFTALAAHFVRLTAHPHGSVRPVYSGIEFSFVWEADFRIRAGTAVLCFLRLGRRTVRIRQAYRAWRDWMRPPAKA
ncbi:DUF2953 domain-containing protein [Cohnella zeiphila]|uniref:DUF2953 domain-containing protein n=1 Tax=Cohnella zeiphila TaxID=2761120 RepID=A0A7X0STH5_9BACL|nr:DUF2953 domain-containing protein [Cohnella zeiphila]MBB6735822.1 DUF2953 domain-containing protein [Cohnella zeiphila]